MVDSTHGVSVAKDPRGQLTREITSARPKVPGVAGGGYLWCVNAERETERSVRGRGTDETRNRPCPKLWAMMNTEKADYNEYYCF